MSVVFVRSLANSFRTGVFKGAVKGLKPLADQGTFDQKAQTKASVVTRFATNKIQQSPWLAQSYNRFFTYGPHLLLAIQIGVTISAFTVAFVPAAISTGILGMNLLHENKKLPNVISTVMNWRLPRYIIKLNSLLMCGGPFKQGLAMIDLAFYAKSGTKAPNSSAT